MTSSIYNPRKMGAYPSETGTHFRVWAPHANSVAVIGEFNNWDVNAHLLKAEENGLWAIDVPGAKVGQQYQFEIVNGDKRLRKNDAYAREIHAEKATSVIYQDSYEWKHADCVLPNWNELLIYELHVGNFCSGPRNGPGRFEQVASRLPYLKSLGVNAIEIMPPMAFPGERSWGYNLTHPFARPRE